MSFGILLLLGNVKERESRNGAVGRIVEGMTICAGLWNERMEVAGGYLEQTTSGPRALPLHAVRKGAYGVKASPRFASLTQGRCAALKQATMVAGHLW